MHSQQLGIVTSCLHCCDQVLLRCRLLVAEQGGYRVAWVGRLQALVLLLLFVACVGGWQGQR